jgi:hypothetical protein
MLRRSTIVASITLLVLGTVASNACAQSAGAGAGDTDDADAQLTAPDLPAPRPAESRWDTSKDAMAIGMTLHRFQDDFGLGATVTSPEIAHWFRFTLGGGVAWFPNGRASDGSQTWQPFEHGRLVMEIGPGYLRGVPIRPYGFSGVTVLMLPSALSTDHVAVGGLGGFGFELAFTRPDFQGAPGGPTAAPPAWKTGPVTYYAELGGIGTSAHASALPGNESIASGFLITTGLRAYL